MSSFEPAINIVLKHEGGLADISEDPGGLTKYGISSKNYPDLDVKNLTLAQAKSIYKRDYWDRRKLGSLISQPIANLTLDMTVHHGQGVRLIQKALRDTGEAVTIDNLMGPQTRSALNKVAPTAFINNAVNRRKEYMQSLVDNNPKLGKFLAGWLTRANFFFQKPGMLMGTGILTAITIGITVYFLWPKGKKKLF